MNNHKKTQFVSNIFNSSIALIGLCFTLVTIFQITNKSQERIIDELLIGNCSFYFISLVCSFIEQKTSSQLFYHIAYIVFFMGLATTIISSFILLFEL